VDITEDKMRVSIADAYDRGYDHGHRAAGWEYALIFFLAYCFFLALRFSME